MQETQVRFLGQEDTLEKGMAIHSSILAWRIPEEPGELQSMGSQRLKFKEVQKMTRPFGYDLNQIPYDYTVEVRNRFKGLDLVECLKNYG